MPDNPDLEQMFGADLPDIGSAGTMLFDPIWALKEHLSSSSDDSEMIHVIRGNVELQMTGKRYKAGPGDTLLIPFKTPHKDCFDIEDELEVFFCRFKWKPAKQFFEYVDNDAIVAMPSYAKAEIMRNFDLMRGDFRQNSGLDKILFSARIFTMLILMLREAVNKKSPGLSGEHAEPGKSKRSRLMTKAKEFIEKNYADCVTLDEIAAALRVSSYHLSHVFGQESDFTLSSYLTKVRMDKARALLVEGKLTVSEVACAVGFESANYFSKVFSKHCGCAPSEYAARGGRG